MTYRFHKDTFDGYMPKHHHHHSDTECACVCKPDDECNNCICVTSADVALWNTASAISSISGVENLSALSSVQTIVASADNWNSVYDTVYSYSSVWNESSAISSVSSDLNERIDEIVETIPELKTTYYSNSISGDGNINSPYGVKSFDDITNDIRNLLAMSRELYATTYSTSDVNGNTPKWLHVSSYNKFVEELAELVEENKIQQINIENNRTELKKITNTVESLDKNNVKIVVDNKTVIERESDVKKLKAPNTVYYILNSKLCEDVNGN